MPAFRRMFAALTVLLLGFAAHAQEPQANPPFITTPQDVVDRMLRMAGTGPQDTVMDLGSGDGRIVIAAARDFGARGIGVEINPRLVALSRDNARKAGVAERTQFEEEDVLKTDLGRASVVTVYLLPFLIDQLQPKFLDELKPGTRIVTHAFGMKGWNPDRSESVKLARPQPSQGATSDIHLWIVPAQARGDWQAPGWRLTIHQNFQQVEVEGEAGGQRLAVDRAKLEGALLSFSGAGYSFQGRVEARRIAGELTRGGVASPIAFTRR